MNTRQTLGRVNLGNPEGKKKSSPRFFPLEGLAPGPSFRDDSVPLGHCGSGVPARTDPKQPAPTSPGRALPFGDGTDRWPLRTGLGRTIDHHVMLAGQNPQTARARRIEDGHSCFGGDGYIRAAIPARSCIEKRICAPWASTYLSEGAGGVREMGRPDRGRHPAVPDEIVRCPFSHRVRSPRSHFAAHAYVGQSVQGTVRSNYSEQRGRASLNVAEALRAGGGNTADSFSSDLRNLMAPPGRIRIHRSDATGGRSNPFMGPSSGKLDGRADLARLFRCLRPAVASRFGIQRRCCRRRRGKPVKRIATRTQLIPRAILAGLGDIEDFPRLSARISIRPTARQYATTSTSQILPVPMSLPADYLLDGGRPDQFHLGVGRGVLRPRRSSPRFRRCLGPCGSPHESRRAGRATPKQGLLPDWPRKAWEASEFSLPGMSILTLSSKALSHGNSARRCNRPSGSHSA